MKKIPKVLYRYRLMTSILALVLLLGGLFVTPASADENFVLEGGVICDNGCIGWNVQNGCVRCLRCCANSSNGEYACWLVDAGLCP